jgi:hypothetical protein
MNERKQEIDAMFSGILYKKEDKKWNSCYRNLKMTSPASVR